MYLKKVTLILIFSMIVSFFVRTLGTLFPWIFQNIVVVKAAILINAFFMLTHLLFWLFFFSEYISSEKPALKKPCILVIAGSLAVSILYLKKVLFIFEADMGFLPVLASPYVDAVVPLISAVVHLLFFVLFKDALESDETPSLNRPVLSMIAGISIYMVLHIIVLANLIASGRFAWLEHMPRYVPVGTGPLVVSAACLMLFFYFRFYWFLTGGNSCENPRHDPG